MEPREVRTFRLMPPGLTRFRRLSPNCEYSPFSPPVTMAIAGDWGTPAGSKFRTVVRCRSWGSRSGTLAFSQAFAQDFRRPRIGRPYRLWRSAGPPPATDSGPDPARAEAERFAEVWAT